MYYPWFYKSQGAPPSQHKWKSEDLDVGFQLQCQGSAIPVFLGVLRRRSHPISGCIKVLLGDKSWDFNATILDKTMPSRHKILFPNDLTLELLGWKMFSFTSLKSLTVPHPPPSPAYLILIVKNMDLYPLCLPKDTIIECVISTTEVVLVLVKWMKSALFSALSPWKLILKLASAAVTTVRASRILMGLLRTKGKNHGYILNCGIPGPVPSRHLTLSHV